MSPAPVLETERLRLRGHCADDFERCAALWANPDVVRFIGGKPFTREESWMRMMRHAGNWALMGYGSWLVEEKVDGKFAGEIGFMTLKRDIEPKLEGFPEMGWVLCPCAHGKGYASEAVRAALVWGDSQHACARVTCIIATENQASIGVAEKNGFREFSRTIYKGDPIVLFERFASSGVKK